MTQFISEATRKKETNQKETACAGAALGWQPAGHHQRWWPPLLGYHHRGVACGECSDYGPPTAYGPTSSPAYRLLYCLHCSNLWIRTEICLGRNCGIWFSVPRATGRILFLLGQQYQQHGAGPTARKASVGLWTMNVSMCSVVQMAVNSRDDTPSEQIPHYAVLQSQKAVSAYL